MRGHHWPVAAALEWGILSAPRLGDAPQAARMWTVQARIFTLLHLFDRASAALDEATRLMAGVDQPRLESSTMEVRARLAEERASHADVPDYSPAEDALRGCLHLDERSGGATRGGPHRRMLAKRAGQGRPEEGGGHLTKRNVV